MAEKRGLSHTAYGGIKGEDYIPFVPVSQAMPELTIVSIIMGCIFAMIFGAANTYLGLKVGMTIAAGIPAAIIATGILKGIFKTNNILEANIIQSMASMGESLAGGLIFIIPAVILLGENLKLSTIILVALLGGLLGIVFVVPLRKYLIVEEHGNLTYPEGMAASEVLVTGSEGGAGFATVMTGVAGGGLYKLLSGGFKFWSEEPLWTIKPLENTMFGVNVLASLVGVGYIVGLEIGMYMFSGALVAWFGLIPLIKFVGAGLTVTLFPSTVLISEMDAYAIWSKYVRYIGAGAVAAGGFISLAKSLPTIVRSFKSAMSGIGGTKGGEKRIDKDMPLTWVIGGAVAVFVLSWVLPLFTSMPKIGPWGALLAVIFAFFFGVVSARIVGVIGTSNNPISGMTIATLLFITAVIKATGVVDTKGMLAAIIAGSIVCVAIACAGGTSQSLKTTYIIGGTPKYVEIAMYIAVIASAAIIGLVILMLDSTYGIGGKDVAAPQATMMSMVAKGVMTGDLPWSLVAIGATFGIMVELMGIPVLPFALGLYLPISLSSGVLVGGILRKIVDFKFRRNDAELKERTERGILLSSGLVAGDALVGIVIAAFVGLQSYTGFDIGFGPKIIGDKIANNSWLAAFMCLVLCVLAYLYIVGGKKSSAKKA